MKALSLFGLAGVVVGLSFTLSQSSPKIFAASATPSAPQTPNPASPSHQETWSRDVAPVIYAHCTTCHHPGGAGPFSLTTYQDAKRWAPQVLTVTQSRFMPP